MSEPYPEYFLAEPDSYVAAHGVMLATSESVEKEDTSLNCVSLIFIDVNESLHPVLMHPQGGLVDYLLSDEFRKALTSLRDSLVDKGVR